MRLFFPFPPPFFSCNANKILSLSSSIQSQLPQGSIPTLIGEGGDKLTSNEIYLDIIEDVDAIVERLALDLPCLHPVPG